LDNGKTTKKKKEKKKKKKKGGGASPELVYSNHEQKQRRLSSLFSLVTTAAQAIKKKKKSSANVIAHVLPVLFLYEFRKIKWYGMQKLVLEVELPVARCCHAQREKCGWWPMAMVGAPGPGLGGGGGRADGAKQ